VVQGQTVWRGIVEVFSLTNHPKAKLCYAWSHREGPKDKGERFVAVLGVPPADSAKRAIQVAIVQEAKSKKA
jgi:hypothetical protein